MIISNFILFTLFVISPVLLERNNPETHNQKIPQGDFLEAIQQEENRRRTGQVILTTTLLPFGILVFLLTYYASKLSNDCLPLSRKGLSKKHSRRKETLLFKILFLLKMSKKQKTQKQTGTKNNKDNSPHNKHITQKKDLVKEEKSNLRFLNRFSEISLKTVIGLLLFLLIYFALYINEWRSLPKRKESLQAQFEKYCSIGFEKSSSWAKRLKNFINGGSQSKDRDKFNQKCCSLKNEIQHSVPHLTLPYEIIIEEIGNSFETAMKNENRNILNFFFTLISSVCWKSILFFFSVVMLWSTILKAFIPHN
ncbi:hypothetical protein M0812_26852 [Anaeramoeba flamelloides]|uniref:Uncharacterized protein n=1 Tax=Anaeramoeba flamelloides TaxID=1746091 RepID=A0AAV7YBU8_9EUKA|nr:hypothetical protein M0812_26852 [Anaeramoeba flamelloides]